MPADRGGVLGLLLAGGASRRMGGGDKCLRQLGKATILTRVIARTRPQVDALLLNANGDPGRFAAFDLPVADDVVGGLAGPLAGVLTGMEWARQHRPDLPWIVSIATDTPFLPLDLVARLLRAIEAEGADMACATSNDRAHPVFGLWPVRLADDLRTAMVDEGIRKVDLWTARYNLVQVSFGSADIDPFFNTNRPDDLARAGIILEQVGENDT